jgi:hypothetical protein
MATPPWWDPAFTSRFPLSVSAPPNYTLRIDASTVLAAGPDVRVVVHDATDARELDRVLESPALSFRVPSAGSVWLYAGPGPGTAKANPANVYLFAEDFESAAPGAYVGGLDPLPATEWTVVDDGGNHIIRTAFAGRHPAAVRNLLVDDVEISARMRYGPGGSQNHCGLAARGNSMAVATMDGFVGQLMQNIQRTRIAEYTDGISPPIELVGLDRPVPRDTWFELRMRIIADTLELYVDGALQLTAVKTGSDGRMVGIFAVDNDTDFDDVRIRLAQTPEPVATIGAEQHCP